MGASKTVLLTGATGFVGRHLLRALEAAGHTVRCGTRSPTKARRKAPECEWVGLDVEKPDTLPAVLQGCDAAYYLIHGMQAGHDYPEREARSAEAFRAAAEEARLERLVYLGGVEPAGIPSRHLRSRLHTGRILRDGKIPTFELRAAMIVGDGSASWRIVRDLSARLPAMVLPRWLQHHSWPVAIDDVVAGLVHCLEMPVGDKGWYDAPGPERLSHRELLERVSAALQRHPTMVNVPVLSPRLSSYWIALVTSADLGLAQELVEGLKSDLDPTGPLIWEKMPEHRLMPLDVAIRQTLAAERSRP